jgi:hypothetical protein
MEMQEWVPLVLLLSNKVFCTAATIQMYLGLHVKCPVLLSDFNQLWSFMTDFCKSHQYHIL